MPNTNTPTRAEIQDIVLRIENLDRKVEQLAKLISHYGLAYPVASGELDIMQRLDQLERAAS